jgi:hypothetical protein
MVVMVSVVMVARSNGVSSGVYCDDGAMVSSLKQLPRPFHINKGRTKNAQDTDNFTAVWLSG